MRKALSLIWVAAVTAGFLSSAATAEDIKLPLTADSPWGISNHTPDKAVDGKYYTYWLADNTEYDTDSGTYTLTYTYTDTDSDTGTYTYTYTYTSTSTSTSYDTYTDTDTYTDHDRNDGPWWIVFDAASITQIDMVNIKWYSSYILPEDYDIQVSDNGSDWEYIYRGIRGEYSVSGEIRKINRRTRYIRLYINKMISSFPMLKEFEAYQKGIPPFMRFQGRLKDAENEPLEGTFELTFRIYSVETGGDPLWEETRDDISVKNGFIDIELGSVTPLDLSFDRQYWLGVEVESTGEMEPRFKLTSLPYTYRSEK